MSSRRTKRKRAPKGRFEDEALPYLEWAVNKSEKSGVLAEQFHPYTGAPISVSPLTWSHSTYLAVVMRYLNRRAELGG